jgi:hypothetical protein
MSATRNQSESIFRNNESVNPRYMSKTKSKKESRIVCFVGISGKPGKNGTLAPLSEETLSGKIISQVEAKLRTIAECSAFFRDNIVKNPPMQNGKLRYPSKKEMESEWSFLERRLVSFKSNVVILLGQVVADFFKDKKTIEIMTCASPDMKLLKWIGRDESGTIFLAVAHPSYVGVYARKSINKYSDIIFRAVQGLTIAVEP